MRQQYRTRKEIADFILRDRGLLISRGLYTFDQYRSIDVYKAVTEMGVEDIETFLSQYDIVRDRDRN